MSNCTSTTTILPIRHPWKSTIQMRYSERIKHAHNSIKNPRYPDTNIYRKKKVKIPEKEKDQFTIIGNRFTKEYLYCKKLVEELYKYRLDYLRPPIVRGVTPLEWPYVFGQLKIEIGPNIYCYKGQIVILHNGKYIGGEKELRSIVAKKYIYRPVFDYQLECEAEFLKFFRSTGRSFAYMHFMIANKHIGTMIFILYTDICPRTCENFLRLCELRRGGYSGTPVHRIVKDAWIQCGGFTLKKVPFCCENFIVPFDRRGVLAMANDGRDIDCSTQFFVLLQPADWMAKKYVAFGQLVDGENTLATIENEETWYESPKQEIRIFRAGVLNLECKDLSVNKNVYHYIDRHTEDLTALGTLLMEEVMKRVNAEIDKRYQNHLLEEEETKHVKELKTDIRATERFLRKKDEPIQKVDKKSERLQSKRVSIAVVDEQEGHENETQEAEEYCYPSVIVSDKPPKKRPYYLAITDVPDPHEIESNFDLKKFFAGHYCLESDLETNKFKDRDERKSNSEIVIMAHLRAKHDERNEKDFDDEDSVDLLSLDTDDQNEVMNYLRKYSDKVSFGGKIIQNIMNSYKAPHIIDTYMKRGVLSDDELRKIRMVIKEQKRLQQKTKVSIFSDYHKGGIVKRRPTGFVRSADLTQLSSTDTFALDDLDDMDPLKLKNAGDSDVDDDDDIKNRYLVDRISVDSPKAGSDDDDDEMLLSPQSSLSSRRKNVMARLYEENRHAGDHALKDYRPASDVVRQKSQFLTSTEESFRKTTLGHEVISYVPDSFTVLTTARSRIVRKPRPEVSGPSGFSLSRIENIENEKFINSLRYKEYSKVRPALTVEQYKCKNRSQTRTDPQK